LSQKIHEHAEPKRRGRKPKAQAAPEGQWVLPEE